MKVNCKPCMDGRHSECVDENCLCREGHSKQELINEFTKTMKRVLPKNPDELKRIIKKSEKEAKKRKAKKLENKKESKDTRQDSKKLFDFADGHIVKTVISTYDSSKVYGLIFVNNHFETLDLNSSRAIQWLSNEYHQVDTDVIHPQDFFKNVLFALTSHAQMNSTVKQKVHTRVAQTNNAIYYDLGSKDYNVVKISKKSISIVKINEKTPMFLRHTSLFEQVKPRYDNENALNELTDLLLVRDKDRIIFKVHLISFFLESCAVPIPVATGSAGSAKSTFTAYWKVIVDPSGRLKENNLMGFPKKIDDLVATESHRYMIAFDNVSEVDQEISDELCRSITGGSTSNRKLYTNSDESISSYKNKICLNGIVPRLNYPDLQTRIISYPRKSLDENNTLSEAKLEEKFQTLLPDVLGCVFKTLQKALKLFPSIAEHSNPKQRLGDFEIWGETIAQCLGYKNKEFRLAYDEKLKEDTINAKESHVIVDLIETIMEEKDVYENTVKVLFYRIKALAENEGIEIKSKYVFFPKIPNQLTRELTVIDPILKNLGFKVETFPYRKRDDVFKRNTKIVRISRVKSGGLETFLK